MKERDEEEKMMKAARFSGKGKIALSLFMASIFCLFTQPVMATGTELIHAVIDLPLTLPFGVNSGTYQATLGPHPVSEFSKLRIYASIYSGSSITVTITVTDKTGKKVYGTLDTFTLSSSTTIGTSTSAVYDCPGTYVVIQFTSGEAATAVSTAIYGLVP
jgi:hypothetical protein